LDSEIEAASGARVPSFVLSHRKGRAIRDGIVVVEKKGAVPDGNVF